MFWICQNNHYYLVKNDKFKESRGSKGAEFMSKNIAIKSFFAYSATK